YYYRIKVQNGDGKIVSTMVSASTTTLVIPPPVVNSVSPSTVENLGEKIFTVSGSNFQSGATFRIQKSAVQFILPTSVHFDSETSVTGTFNMTGALAGPWSIAVENPDGRSSTGSGSNLLTVTDASSQGSVTIVNYTASAGLTITT